MRIVLKIIIIIILSLNISDSAYSLPDNQLPITIVKLDPYPNYGISKNNLNLSYLTDGEISIRKMWKNNGFSGWSRVSPVLIVLKLMSIDSDLHNTPRNMSGIIKFHLAKDTQSEVDLPARIDVFGRATNGMFTYLSSVQPKSNLYVDNSSHWIETELTGVFCELYLVIHAKGQYIFLDEVIFQEKILDVRDHTTLVQEVKNPISDSLARLKVAYLSDYAEVPGIVDAWVDGFGDDNTVIWSESPWDEIPHHPTVNYIKLRMDKQIDLVGFNWEHESACIGILNTASHKKYLNISIKPSIVENGVRFFIVKPVLAANGKYVYDPLVPIENDEVVIPPRSKAYIWVSVELKQLMIGKN